LPFKGTIVSSDGTWTLIKVIEKGDRKNSNRFHSEIRIKGNCLKDAVTKLWIVEFFAG